MVRAAHAAAQLVQLGEPETVGAIDDDRVRRRDVDAAFDDRRAQQDVEASMVEVEHYLFELAFGQLAVADPNLCLRHEFCDLLFDLADVLDAVVDEIDLAAALDFAQAGLPNQDIVPLTDKSLHGQPLRRRRRDQRHVAQAAEGHVQGSRNWRRRQRQYVDLAPERFYRLLVSNAETMLLVDDHETDVVHLFRVLQQAMRADDDVDGAGSHAGNDFPDLLRRLKARQHLDPNRPVCEAIPEVFAVLLREQRRRHEYCHLLAAIYRSERRTQRDLGLAESDVAANDPVHRLIRGQVGEYVVDGRRLVLGKLERKTAFECPVVRLGPAESMARPSRPAGIRVEQFGSDVPCASCGALSCPGPLIAAEPVQRSVLG